MTRNPAPGPMRDPAPADVVLDHTSGSAEIAEACRTAESLTDLRPAAPSAPDGEDWRTTPFGWLQLALIGVMMALAGYVIGML